MNRWTVEWTQWSRDEPWHCIVFVRSKSSRTNVYEKYMFSDTSFTAFLQQFYCNFTQVGWTKWSRDEPWHCIVFIRYPSWAQMCASRTYIYDKYMFSDTSFTAIFAEDSVLGEQQRCNLILCWKWKFPVNRSVRWSVGWMVGRSVGRSVCHNFLKEREVSFLYKRSTSTPMKSGNFQITEILEVLLCVYFNMQTSL